MVALRPVALSIAEANPDEANGLILGATAGPCDSGNADSGTYAQSLADAPRHLFSNHITDRAILFQCFGLNAKKLLLDLVGIAYYPTEHIIGAACYISDT